MNTIKRFCLTAMLLLFSANAIMAFFYHGINYEPTGPNTCRAYENRSDSVVGNIIIPTEAHMIWSTVNHEGQTIWHDSVFTVTEIRWLAFRGCKRMTSITIPNTVTSIGGGAFTGCSSLTRVTLPQSLTIIAGDMFDDCTSLTSVSIPGSVTTIQSDAFYNCSSLKSISIPGSVTTIGNYAFSFSGLTSINIPSSVTTIGEGAFAGCSNLTSISVPASVTSLGASTFRICTSLTNVNFSASVPSLNDTFYGCTSLASADIGGTATSLVGTFGGCTSLTSVSLPNSVTSISGQVFGDCTSLKSINIPNSVTSIGGYTFQNCSSLTSINIPRSVTYIGDYAFKNCTGLREINCFIKDPKNVTLGYYIFEDVPKDLCTLHVPAGSLGLFQKAPQWKDFFMLESSIVKHFQNGYGTKADWNSYYGMDEEPTGVTADGLSRMYIFFVDTETVDSLTLTVRVNGVESTDTKLTGSFGPLVMALFDDKQDIFKLCVEYTAPAEFAYSTSSDSYKVEVTFDYSDDDRKHQTVTTDFDVYRPAVILLHGLLSDDGCFSGLAGYLTRSYSPGFVLNGDYSGSHAESFFNNTFVHNVVGRHMNSLFAGLAGRGIISAKYDLVGHSMGGILSRMYAQEVYAKDVNRIITLDTPHSGSQLANLRAPVMNTLDGVSVVTNPILASALRKLTSMFKGNGSLAAIENLAPGSEAIARLNGPKMNNAVGIPVHSIVSVFLDPQGNASGDNGPYYTSPASSTGLTALYDFLYSNLNDPMNQYNFLDWLYDGANDGVVSYKSQAGGNHGNWLTLMTDVYRGTLGADSWAHHCKTNKWIRTYSKIDSLLCLPKSASAFRPSGFHPEAISVPASLMSPAQYPKLRAAGSGTSIALQVERQEADSTVLQIHVTRSSDVIRHMVYTFTGNDEMIFSLDEQDCEFKVPNDYHGMLNVYVLGRTADGELVADEVVLDNGFIKGDVNVDNKVNVTDVTALVNMILGVIPKNEATGDVNSDSKINVSDVTALINIILGIH